MFAKVIEQIGLQTVAALNIVLGEEPFVSFHKTDFKKAPTQIHPICWRLVCEDAYFRCRKNAVAKEDRQGARGQASHSIL